MAFKKSAVYPVHMELSLRVQTSADAFGLLASRDHVQFRLRNPRLAKNNRDEFPVVTVQKTEDSTLAYELKCGPGCYDGNTGTYTVADYRGSKLNSFFADFQAKADSFTPTITLRVTYAEFFHRMISWHSAQDADPYKNRNLACPGDEQSSDLLTSIGLDEGDAPDADFKKVKHSFRSRLLKDLPVKLLSGEEKDDAALLAWVIDMTGEDPALQLEVALAFLAADYTQMLFAGKNDKDYGVWNANLEMFVRNFASLTRGKALFDRIVASCQGFYDGGAKKQSALVPQVKKELRTWIVPANYWDQARRKKDERPYQYTLQEVMGRIHQKHWHASIVKVMRNLEEKDDLSRLDMIYLVLQIGLGHCAEHSQLSFCVLKALMEGDDGIEKKIGTVIMSGWVDVDHAFVVGGYRPRRLLRVKPKGEEEKIAWNIKTDVAVKTGTNTKGFSCDPYLADDQIPATLAEIDEYDVYLTHEARYPMAPGLKIRSTGDPDKKSKAKKPEWWEGQW